MNRRPLLFALCAAAGLMLALLSLWLRQDSPASPLQLTPPAVAKSLLGTSVDGNAQQGSDGDLLVTAELRRLFDYYLASSGEQSLPAISHAIGVALDERLAPRAAQQARQLLQRYLLFKQALPALEQALPGSMVAPSMLSGLQKKWQDMQHLRGQFFSATESRALFGLDDDYDNDALARLALNQDASLTAEQRQLALTRLDQAVSPALRAAREAPYQVLRMEQQAQQLRAQGGSEDEVYRLRAASWSPEAANRLAELDRESADWQTRIHTYQEQRAQLRSTADDSTAQQLSVQALRDRYFTVPEQKRLSAYE